VRLYKTVLLYGCETWTVTKTLAKGLDAFDTRLVPAEDLTYDYSIHQTHYSANTIQCEASPPAHQCRVGSSHSGCVSMGTLLVPLPRRTITVSTVSLPPHLG